MTAARRTPKRTPKAPAAPKAPRPKRAPPHTPSKRPEHGPDIGGALDIERTSLGCWAPRRSVPGVRIPLDPAQTARWRAAADRDHRPLASWVRCIVAGYLHARETGAPLADALGMHGAVLSPLPPFAAPAPEADPRQLPLPVEPLDGDDPLP